jgi:hypothetical protein
LLAAFKQRPLAPPAPRPKQQASSEGGDFVAYSTVARPVARSGGDVPDQSLVELKIARLADLPDSADGAAVAGRRNDPTVLVRARPKRPRALPVVVGVGTVVAIASIAAVLLTLASRAARHPASAGVDSVSNTAMPSGSVESAPTLESVQPPPPPAPTEATAPPPAPPATAASSATATPATSGGVRQPPPRRNPAPSGQFIW